MANDIPPSYRPKIIPIPSSKIEHDLLALGVKPNSVLMVHASMRKMGPVVGGAEAVLESLLKLLTPKGTLLMMLSADPDEPFDHQRTPVDIEDMGILAEVFRKHPEAKVNDHAADRFAALGSKAEYLLRPSPLHDYYGPGSVLERLVNSNGSILRLGANVDTVTLTHYAEYLANIPNKRRVKRRYIRADIGEQWIESLDDSDGIAEWTGGDYFPQILIDFVAEGNAKVGAVGNCLAELLDARLFVDFAVKWLEKNM